MAEYPSQARMEELETAISKELFELFKRGDLDHITKRMAEVMRVVRPQPSAALHLEFRLTFLAATAEDGGSKRIRALGHIAAVADKIEDRVEPQLRVAVSPSFIDDTKPCASCGGSGIVLESAKTPSQLAERPFETTFRMPE